MTYFETMNNLYYTIVINFAWVLEQIFILLFGVEPWIWILQINPV